LPRLYKIPDSVTGGDPLTTTIELRLQPSRCSSGIQKEIFVTSFFLLKYSCIGWIYNMRTRATPYIIMRNTQIEINPKMFKNGK